MWGGDVGQRGEERSGSRRVGEVEEGESALHNSQHHLLNEESLEPLAPLGGLCALRLASHGHARSALYRTSTSDATLLCGNKKSKDDGR